MQKVKGIALIAIALFFIFVSVKAIVTAPDSEAALRSAVWVQDGAIHPENEGKLVAATFKLKEFSAAADPDIGIAFSQPFVRRRVDVVRNIADDMVWDPVDSYDPQPLKSTMLFGVTDDNKLNISPELAVGFPAGRDFTMDEVTITDPDVFNAYNFEVATIDSRLYLTQIADRIVLRDIEKGTSELDPFTYIDLFNYEGAYRITYQVLNDSPEKSFVVVGKQVGNTIEKSDELDAPGVYEDAETIDDLVHSNSIGLTLGIIVVDLICLLLIFVGVRLIRS